MAAAVTFPLVAAVGAFEELRTLAGWAGSSNPWRAAPGASNRRRPDAGSRSNSTFSSLRECLMRLLKRLFFAREAFPAARYSGLLVLEWPLTLHRKQN
jgi:hypothetical protein